jgi:multicomponent Na+:H+ antiporter subunit F
MNHLLLTLAGDTGHAVHEASFAPPELLLVPHSHSMLAWVFTLGLAGIALAMVFAAGRVVLGPSVPDRVVSLDVVANLCVSAIAILAMATQRSGLIVVAIVVALILFLGTTAYALYLERRARA